jgi:hypothetical protein
MKSDTWILSVVSCSVFVTILLWLLKPYLKPASYRLID